MRYFIIVLALYGCVREDRWTKKYEADAKQCQEICGKRIQHFESMYGILKCDCIP